MKLLNFQSENVIVDWISFNIDGLPNVRVIAEGLSAYFTPHIVIDGKPDTEFHNFKNPYKVSIRQYSGSKNYWIGTQLIFSGKNAAYCYNRIKTQKFDWKILIADQPIDRPDRVRSAIIKLSKKKNVDVYIFDFIGTRGDNTD